MQHVAGTLNQKNISTIVSMVCSKYPVRRVYLFGSYARDEQNVDSDIDLYIELDQPIGGFAAGRLYNALEKELGKSIDTIFSTDSDFKIQKRGLRNSIAEDKVLLYDSKK